MQINPNNTAQFNNMIGKIAFSLLSLLVGPAVSNNFEAAFKVIEKPLETLNFSHTIIEGKNSKSFVAWYPATQKDVMGKQTIPQNFDLVFLGHLDVVPAGDLKNWKFSPNYLSIEHGVMYGRGVVDMLGAVAAYIEALDIYLKSLSTLQIGLILTTDEETKSFGAREVIDHFSSKGGVTIKRLLVGEPTSENLVGDVVKIGRRGSANFDLKIIGSQGHAAYPEKSVNPLSCLNSVIEILNQPLDSGRSTYFLPSHLEITDISSNNDVRNMTPALLNLKFNIRYNDLQTSASLLSLINKALKSKINSRCSFDLQLYSDNSFYLSPLGDFLNIVKQAVSTTTGFSPYVKMSGGTSDARFLAWRYPEMEIVELGLLNSSAHQVDENTTLKDLESLVTIYSKILQYAGTPRG